MAVPWWRGGVDPLWGLRAMNREVARLLNLPEPGAFPPVNVYDGDEEMVVEAMLPGVGTSELDVTVTGDSLTIKGTKPEPPGVPESGFARQERGSGSFSRTIRLPEHPATPSAGHSFHQRFFRWYNHEHYHSGIGRLTPATVHYRHTPKILAARQDVLRAAYAAQWC